MATREEELTLEQVLLKCSQRISRRWRSRGRASSSCNSVSIHEQLGPLPRDILGGDAGLPDLSFADADQRVNYIHKWRLEKNESACDERGCAPLKQITYHLDPTIPAPLRPTVKAGVLAWQPAFDALGFTQAVRVVQPGDADWPRDYDPGDVRFSSVTWLPYPELGLAIGPSVVDPRSGEILYSRPAR